MARSNINPKKKDNKFQLLIRQLYVLELCNLTIPRMHSRKSVKYKSNP